MDKETGELTPKKLMELRNNQVSYSEIADRYGLKIEAVVAMRQRYLHAVTEYRRGDDELDTLAKVGPTVYSLKEEDGIY